MARAAQPRLALAAIGCGLVLSGCGSGSGDLQTGAGDDTGSLSISITDAPVDDVREVWVQFTGIEVKPSDGPAVDYPFDPPLNVDLLTLTGATSTTLLNGASVAAGRYDWVAFDVDADFDDNLDSYVVDDAGGSLELGLPGEASLRLVSGFTVTAGGSTRLVVDWDLRKALSDPIGHDGYLLRPALRITDLSDYGTIAGSVADGLLMDSACDNDLAEDEGDVVYLYRGAGVTPVDVDGTDPEPLTTAAVTQNASAAGAYTYALEFVPPGDYTAAFTCQGLGDDPDAVDELTFTGTRNVTVTAGEETQADFP